jgi:Ni/Fe-hydrogenase 1 B-type cytochrome subunit
VIEVGRAPAQLDVAICDFKFEVPNWLLHFGKNILYFAQRTRMTAPAGTFAKKDIDSISGSIPGFNGPHGAAIRIWHWSLFLFVSASFLTVLLASTVFRARNTAAMVRDELQAKGTVVNADQARAVAHAYSDILWDIHKWLGFGICLLVLLRIIIELTGPRPERLGTQIKKALGLKPIDRQTKIEMQQFIQVKRIYVVFYLALLLMALTGLGLAFEDIPFLRTLHSTIKQLHGFLQWVIYGFVLIHLAGVILADLGKHNGLVSRMIHGKKA